MRCAALWPVLAAVAAMLVMQVQKLPTSSLDQRVDHLDRRSLIQQASQATAADDYLNLSSLALAVEEFKLRRWSQVVAGTQKSYLANTLTKPLRRFGHTLTSMEESLFDNVNTLSRVYLFGGKLDQPFGDLWIYRVGVANATFEDADSATAPLIISPEGECSTFTLGSRCAIWEQLSPMELLNNCPRQHTACTNRTCLLNVLDEVRQLNAALASASGLFQSSTAAATDGGESSEAAEQPEDEDVSTTAPGIGDEGSCYTEEQQIAAGLARFGHSAALLRSSNERAQASGNLLVFGGFDGSSRKGDMWLYNFGANAWLQLDRTVMGTPPPAREDHTATHIFISSSSTVMDTVVNETRVVREATAAERAQSVLDLADVISTVTRNPMTSPSILGRRKNNLVKDLQELRCQASEGEFRLRFAGATTPCLDYNVRAGEIAAALEALPGITEVAVNITNLDGIRFKDDEGGGCTGIAAIDGIYSQVNGPDRPCCEADLSDDSCVLKDPGSWEVCSTAASLAETNSVQITFLRTTSCDVDEQCDLPLLEILPGTGGTCEELSGQAGRLATAITKLVPGISPYDVYIHGNFTSSTWESGFVTSREVVDTEFGSTVVTRNETYHNFTTVDIRTNETTVLDVRFNTVLAESSTSGFTGMLVFGGWAGEPLNDLWMLRMEEELPDTYWDGSTFTYDLHIAGTWNESYQVDNPNRDAELHLEHPVLPRLNVWQQVNTTGSRPPPRNGHVAEVLGRPGGIGVERYRMLIYGGAGTTGLLGDTWELSLEEAATGGYDIAPSQLLTCAATAGNFTLSWGGANATVSSSDSPAAVQSALAALCGGCGVRVSSADGSICSLAGSTANITFPDVRADFTVPAANFSVLPVLAFNSSLDSTGNNASISTSIVEPGVASVVPAWQWAQVVTADAPPARRHASLTAIRGDDGYQLLYLFGGWDGNQPLNDLWLLRPSSTSVSTQASYTWTQLRENSGRWLSCAANFFPQSLFGFTCTPFNTDLPERYGHASVAITTTVHGANALGGDLTKQGVLSFGGVSSRIIPNGNNTDRWGWWTGGRDPDLMAICDGADLYCWQPITRGAAPALAPSRVMLVLPVLLAVFFMAL